MHIFWPAWMAGFCLAAVPGPLAVLCTQRTLARGLWSGLRTGGGIAVGDAIWTLIAAMAWTQIATVFATPWTGRVAGLVLIIMAAHLWQTRTTNPGVKRPSERTEFWSALAWTLANPMTIATMAALMAAFGSSVAVVPFVLGIALGSLAWWTLLSLGVARGCHLMPPSTTLWLSRGGALLLLLWGLHAMLA